MHPASPTGRPSRTPTATHSAEGAGLGLGRPALGLALAPGSRDAPGLALAPGEPLGARRDGRSATATGAPASTPAICSVLIAMNPSPVVTAVASRPCA